MFFYVSCQLALCRTQGHHIFQAGLKVLSPPNLFLMLEGPLDFLSTIPICLVPISQLIKCITMKSYYEFTNAFKWKHFFHPSQNKGYCGIYLRDMSLILISGTIWQPLWIRSLLPCPLLFAVIMGCPRCSVYWSAPCINPCHSKQDPQTPLSASPGSLLEMQNLGTYFRPTDQNLYFNKSSWWFLCTLKFQKAGLIETAGVTYCQSIN